MTNQLGSQPIEERHRSAMKSIAEAIDHTINPDGQKKWGFILMLFPFEGHVGRCNYISSAERETVITLLKEQLAYFQGQPEPDKQKYPV